MKYQSLFYNNTPLLKLFYNINPEEEESRILLSGLIIA